MASGSVCSAIGCNLYAGNSHGVSFFRFPRDPKRCQKWITNCHRKDLEAFLKRSTEYLYFNHKLCANHFDDSQFATKMGNRLVPNAVPTLFNVPDKMVDPSLKATTQKIASGEKVTHLSDHGTVGQTILEPDGSLRSGKRRCPVPEDPSCGIYLEMLSDPKLTLTPAVVLERVTLPELPQKEIKENPTSQPEVVSQSNPVIKTAVEREDAVKQLKQDLQKLKQELDKERTWHKNLDSYVEMVEQKHQRKDETIERKRSIQLQKLLKHQQNDETMERERSIQLQKLLKHQQNDETMESERSSQVLKHQQNDETMERERSSQLQKQTNVEALLASPFWIKVEEASDSPDKKVYYVFSGINGAVDPGAITVTNLPCSVNQHQTKTWKSITSTSKNSVHETMPRKSNEEQGDGRIKTESTVLQQTTLDITSNIGPYGTKLWESNKEQGDEIIEVESTVLKKMLMQTPANDTSKNSPRGKKNTKSNEGRVERRMARDSMVLVIVLLTARDGRVKYKCTKCKKRFCGKRGLLHHIAILHSHMSYECYLCQTQYSDKREFSIHLDVCHNAEFRRHNQHCHICGRHFSSRQRLDEHLACHAQEIFGCNACKASFVELGDLKGHLPCPLATPGMPAFLCLRCNETFDKSLQIQRHATGTHSSTPKTENAYVKTYLYSQKQETRIAAKFQGKRYACETCGKRFSLVQALCKHLPCAVKICEVCEKQFKNETKLNLHTKLCHNNQAVNCSICGSRFLSQRKLKSHERLFKGRCRGQLFMCDYCGQSTKYASGLSKHRQTHEMTMPGHSKKYSTNAVTTVKLESDLEFQSSSISEKRPINTQTMLQLQRDCEFLSSSISNKCPKKLESDCEVQSPSISNKCPINAQEMVKCESDTEFLCVD